MPVWSGTNTYHPPSPCYLSWQAAQRRLLLNAPAQVSPTCGSELKCRPVLGEAVWPQPGPTPHLLNSEQLM